MSDYKKLWVIEDNSEPGITSLGDALVEAPGRRAQLQGTKRRLRISSTAPRTVARPSTAPVMRLHPAILLVLAFALGPAAILLTKRGRHSGLWVGVATLCVAAAFAVAGGWWYFLRGEMPKALLPALVLAGTLTIATVATVWSRALHLLLTAHHFPANSWFAWQKNPWVALVGGLAAPGSAMAVARRPRLAALTAWWTWPGLAAALLLVQAPLIWRHREAFPGWGIGWGLPVCALGGAVDVIVAAAAFWVSQALVGARTLAVRGGRWQSTRGDWTGVGLVAATAVFLIAVQPGALATDLAVYASSMADAECQIIPIGLNKAAQRLDPGEVAYTLQGADLHAARGDLETAQDMRADLQRRLRPYLGLLAESSAPAPAANPGGSDTESPSPLIRSVGVGPLPPTGRPAPDEPIVRPAVAMAQIFGPVLIPTTETAVERSAPADSLP